MMMRWYFSEYKPFDNGVECCTTAHTEKLHKYLHRHSSIIMDFKILRVLDYWGTPKLIISEKKYSCATSSPTIDEPLCQI